MTVTSTNQKVTYNGDGSTTVFAYNYKIFAQTDLLVILRVTATGTETTQSLTTNYTVSGVGEASGGNVTMGTAPASGTTLTILRVQPNLQGLDLVPNDPFPAGNLEASLDKLTFMVQTHEEEIGRSIKASKANTITTTDFTISATDRANKVFAFDSSGDLSVTQELGIFRGNWAASTAYAQRDLVKDTSTANIFIVNTAHTSSGSQPLTTNTDAAKYDLIVDAASATTSKDAAASSATASANSATASSNSAATSSTKADESAASATTSSTKAGEASTSATAAASSATAAASSATASANSATSAAASAADVAKVQGITNGTVAANKAMVVDANKDISGGRNLTISGELDAATLDISGAIDVAGTANLDVVDIDGALTQDGGAVFNEASADVDFRVESNGNANMLFVDGGNDVVGIGTTSANAVLTTDPESGNFVATYNNYDGVGLFIRGNGTSGDGNYGPALAFGSADSDTVNQDHKHAAISIVQTGSDPNETGLAFWTHPTVTAADALSEAMRISSDGSISTPTSGTSNLRLGVNAGNSIASGGNFNVALGDEAGTALTTGDQNVFVGYQAGDAQTTASQNTFVGMGAATANTEGTESVALGYKALGSNTVGSKSTAIGYLSLFYQNYSSATDSHNTAVGHLAGQNVTTGVFNTLIGSLAGDALTTGGENTAVGLGALTADTLGSHTVAIGRGTLEAQNFTSATDSNNTAVGTFAGRAVTTGVQNTLIGGSAGDALNDADFNVALGFGALTADTKGSRSLAIGNNALQSQNFTSSTNSNNIAIGHDAGRLVSTGVQNTFVGANCGDGTNDGASNTAIGYDSLSANCGNNNTATGRFALTNCTGGNNTAIGDQAGNNVTSGSNLLLLGKDAGITGSPGGNLTSGNNDLVLGDENISGANIQVSFTVASDQRDKTDFTALDLGLDFVKALAPVTYKWDKRSKYGDKTADDYDLNAQTPDGTHKEDWLDIGFKAQEVEALEIAAGYKIADKTNLVTSLTSDGKQYGMQYEKFVPILVKAIQEQNALIEALTARVATLEG